MARHERQLWMTERFNQGLAQQKNHPPGWFFCVSVLHFLDMKNFNRQLAQVFKWLLLLPAFIPLLYVDGMLYPYLSPKTFLFRALGILAVAVFVYLTVSGYPLYFKRLKNRLNWLPAGLLVVAYATSLTGVGFYHSFWSTFDRGDGLLTLSVIVVFFYLILLYAGKDFLQKFLKITALVGSLVAVHAFLQWVEIVSGLHFPGIALPSGRLGGTLGNAAFLASYLGMTAFVTLAVAREYKDRIIWKRAAYFSAILQFLIIFLTATRGSIISLIVLGTIALIYLSWKGTGRSRIVARSGITVLIVLSIIFATFRTQLSQSSFEPVRRIASISLADETVSSRLFLWKHLGSAIREKPLTGFGAEQIDTVFDREYDPSAILEQWFDRSHNAFIDYFLQYGVIGGLLYISILISGIIFARRLYKKGDIRGISIGAVVLIYTFQNIFVFDTAVTLWLLFVLIALTSATLDDSAAISMQTSPAKKWTAGVFALLIASLIIPVSIEPLRANLLLAEGYLYHVADVARANDAMKKGLALNTYADLEYGYQAYSNYTDRQVQMLEGNERVQGYEYTRDLLEKNFGKYTYDARTATYFAHVLELVPPGTAIDEALLYIAIDRAILLSPHRIQPWYLWANIFLRKGDVSKNLAEKKTWYLQGIEVLEQYAKQEPHLSEPRYILANLYLSINDRVSAGKWAGEGLALYKKNEDTARRAMKYYLGVEDWANMARFMEDVISMRPDDYDTTYDLAKASFLAGNKARALELVEHLKRVKPGLVETDPAFMEAIKK
ncbi:hypothetical protein EPO17_02470 [Patescibacteria group bacterium]|nr:MAG: hypothetical protein EPO17_02470 [Patescibacteria group bacterium]